MLVLCSNVTTAASVSNVSTWFVTGRLGSSKQLTQLNTQNGAGGTSTYTITDTSTSGVNNQLTFTNSYAANCTCSMFFVGAMGL